MTYLYNIENADEYINHYPGMTITHPDGYPYIDIICIDVDEMPTESVIFWLDDQNEWGETELEVLHDLCKKLHVDDQGISPDDSLDECRTVFTIARMSSNDEEEATAESKLWYAVMRDRDDIDWGTGSYDLDEARELMNDWRKEGWPNAYIAVIDESGELGAVCVDEYHD